MKRLRSLGGVALPLLVALLLAACGGTPATRFYTLSSLSGQGETESFPSGQARQVVGIGPVALAKYLDHPAITTRSGSNTVTRAELDRWGGPLGDEVSRVLVENMRQLLPGGRYLILPWLETTAIDYRVQFDITRFEKTHEGLVVLNAAWLLFGREGDPLLASGDEALVEAVHGGGYAAISDSMSRSLAELSRRVAGAIRTAGAGGE